MQQIFRLSARLHFTFVHIVHSLGNIVMLIELLVLPVLHYLQAMLLIYI